MAKCFPAKAKSLRLEVLPLYRNLRLPDAKHEELALLRKRVEMPEQQEEHLRQKQQKLSTTLKNPA